MSPLATIRCSCPVSRTSLPHLHTRAFLKKSCVIILFEVLHKWPFSGASHSTVHIFKPIEDNSVIYGVSVAPWRTCLNTTPVPRCAGFFREETTKGQKVGWRILKGGASAAVIALPLEEPQPFNPSDLQM